jgi:uncharacterized protein (TIGR00645 family)
MFDINKPLLTFMRYLTRVVGHVIFVSRWLQAPLYLGLIVILGAYVYRFLVELTKLIANIRGITDTQIMLGVLDLIDVVMIANLLIMVIMAGYETFVSKLNLQNNPDQPEWLDEVDAGTMKVKLALALIGISSIHLLRTFIDPAKYTNDAVMWQVIIHLTLVVSAIIIAYTNKLLVPHKANGKVKA